MNTTMTHRNYFIGGADGTGNPFCAGREGGGQLYVAAQPALSENPTNVFSGGWYNITLRQNATHRELFVDGVSVAGPTALQTQYNKGQLFKLGAGGGVSYYDGLMEYVRIYDYALTDAEIGYIAAET